MTSYDDLIELILEVAEVGRVLLVFKSRVGPLARFGYHRGQWCMVLNYTSEYVAQSMDRETVYDALADDPDLALVRPETDESWQWFISEDTEKYRSHCMCGDFRYATNVNDVDRWVKTHGENCYYDPTIQFDYDT